MVWVGQAEELLQLYLCGRSVKENAIFWQGCELDDNRPTDNVVVG